MAFKHARKDLSVPLCVIEIFECSNCHLKEGLRVFGRGARQRRVLIALGGR